MPVTVETFGFYQEINVDNNWLSNYIPFVDNYTGKHFKSTCIMISNDGSKDILISFNKDSNGNPIIDGRIKAGESIIFDRRVETQVNFKGVDVTTPIPIRIWAW